MIRNEKQYRRDAEFDRWAALRRMTPEESIAVGEALLTSEIMGMGTCSDDDQPCSLAIALGIRSEAARNSRVHHDGPKRV